MVAIPRSLFIKRHQEQIAAGQVGQECFAAKQSLAGDRFTQWIA